MASVDDLWVVDFGNPYPAEPGSARPALVVGPSPIFTRWAPSETQFPFVIVVPLTTTHRGLPHHVEVEPTDVNGLAETSLVQCELIRSVNRNRLIHRLGVIETDYSHRVATIIRVLMGY